LGGNVLPDSGAGAVTLTIQGVGGTLTGNYAGSLQDNGSSVLSLSTFGSPFQVLTGLLGGALSCQASARWLDDTPTLENFKKDGGACF